MRPWILSFLVVALAVGLVLVLWSPGDPDPRRGGGAPPPAPEPTLREADVRAYIDVYPRIQDALGRMGRAMQQAAAEGRPADAEALGAEMRARVASWLKPHHLTPADWDLVRRRVEYVVEAIRWERDREQRERELQQTIARKRAALEGLEEGPDRERLREEIARFEAQFGAPPPPVAEEDLELVRSFWSELDRIAVPRASALPPSGRATPDRE